MIHAKGNLRISILSSFSILLFISFASVGAAFNIAVNQYIRSSAIKQLNESRIYLLNLLAQSMDAFNNPESLYPGALDSNAQRNIFRSQLNAFTIDENYELIGQQSITANAQAIATILKNESVNLASLNNRFAKTVTESYYITVANTTLMNKELPIYMIYYVDVTDLTRFTQTVNTMLVMLLSFIWLISVIVTTFLAGSFARPIRQLSLFAARIGEGDFTPNNTYFRDEEFEKLNQVLNQAAKKLTQYDNEQKTFFQNVSHELRTPLMSIKCYAEGIQYDLMEPHHASQTILSETDRLAEMVDDLLYVSKIDNITSSHVTETIDLRELVKSCVNQQQAVAESKNVVITFDMSDKPVILPCVVKHMTRAINNLISNAIRYAEHEVHITCHKRALSIVFSVADDGLGIGSDMLPHVFDRFCKGSGGHNGIGLSIVKSVVEQHKGVVTADNGDKGALFTVTLPA